MKNVLKVRNRVAELIKWPVAMVVLGFGLGTAWGVPIAIGNGNFDVDPVTGSFNTYSPGLGTDSSSLPDWTITGSIDQIGTYWQAPPGGGDSLDMNGYEYAGSISQTVTIDQTGVAAIDFELSGNIDGPPETKTILVTLTPEDGTGDTFSFTLQNAQSHANMDWVSEQALFDITSAELAASDGQFTLTFASTTVGGTPGTLPDSFGPALGNVSGFLDVPDGGPTAILLGAALLGLVGLNWYRGKTTVC
jgi:hypothetical protein